MGTHANRCAVPALHRRWLRRWPALLTCMLSCPVVLAQVDSGLRALAQTPQVQLAGGADAATLPRVDLALLAPMPSAARDPLRLVQANQGLHAPGQLNLALRWRQQSMGGHALDASIWHSITVDPSRTDPADTEPLYGAQVEMQLRRDPKAALRDLLGMKLDNGGRISLRRRNGHLAIYYRVQF